MNRVFFELFALRVSESKNCGVFSTGAEVFLTDRVSETTVALYDTIRKVKETDKNAGQSSVPTELKINNPKIK